MKKELVLAIGNRLINSDLVKYVSLQNGQFDTPEAFKSHSYPAVLIEFLEINHIQQGDLTNYKVAIRLHMAFPSIQSTEFRLGATDIKRLEELETTEKIIALLHGWKPFNPGSTSLNCLRQIQDIDYKNVSVWKADFNLQISCVPKVP